jgi:hypothetical protein
MWFYTLNSNWEYYTELVRPSDYWDYQQRTQRSAWFDQVQWLNLWPRQGGLLIQAETAWGLGGANVNGIGQSNDSYYGGWEPSLLGYSGNIRPNYVRGALVDINSSPVINATVTSFVTATNALDGTTTSDANGNYEAPCFVTSGNHFIVAYKPGSPDIAGTSVNTLTPAT